MAHELDHALTDQALGLPEAVKEPQPGHEDESNRLPSASSRGTPPW